MLNERPSSTASEGSKDDLNCFPSPASPNSRPRKHHQTTYSDVNGFGAPGTHDFDLELARGTTVYDRCTTTQPLTQPSRANSNIRLSQSPLITHRCDHDAPVKLQSSLSSIKTIDNNGNDFRDLVGQSTFMITSREDKRVKEGVCNVWVNGRNFVVVSYAVSGHCDAVYRRSKKIWEQVPLGRAQVFVQVPLPLSRKSSPNQNFSLFTFTLNRNHRSTHEDGNGKPYAESNRTTRSTSSSGREHNFTRNRSYTNTIPSHLALLASLNGIRRFGHWHDAVTYGYAVDRETPVTAIATEKIDGEGGHLTAFSLEGTRYWVIGCRNIYLVLRINSIEDVQCYSEGPSSRARMGKDNNALLKDCNATLAKHVALLWYQLLDERLSSEKVEELHEELCRRRWTCCFDAVISGWEHTVDYGTAARQEIASGDGPTQLPARNAYPITKEACVTYAYSCMHRHPQSGRDNVNFTASSCNASHCERGVPLLFYAATVCESSEKGLCVPVFDAMDFFRRYSLPTVFHQGPIEVNSHEYNVFRTQVSGWLNSAGAVFYGANEHGVVVRIWKCRCYPYLMERAAQELIINHQLRGEGLRTKLEKKLASLPRGTREYTIEWEKQRIPFLVRFADWLHQSKRLTPSTDLRALRHLRSHWITAQRVYQDQDLACRQARGDAIPRGVAFSEQSTKDDGDSSHNAEVLMLIGPQGSGKSTLSRILFALLEQSGFSPRWINQDEVGSRRGYLSAIHQALSEGRYTHIILDKINTSHTLRLDYVPMKLNTILTIAWAHPGGTKALAGLCLERVKRRGSNHRMLAIMQKPQDKQSPMTASDLQIQFRRVEKIIYSCAAEYELPNDDPTLLQVDVTLNRNALIREVWPNLQKHSQYNIPNLSALHIADALEMANSYERLIGRYPHSIRAAVLKADHVEALHALVPPDLLGDGKCKFKLESVQILLHDFTVNPSPTALVRCAPHIGKSKVLTITAIVSDNKASLFCLSEGGTSSSADEACCLSANKNNTTFAQKCIPNKQSRHLRYIAPMSTSNHALINHNTSSIDHIAVISKSKKVSYCYCVDLAQRALNLREPDPYCTMLTLQEQPQATFTYEFVANCQLPYHMGT